MVKMKLDKAYRAISLPYSSESILEWWTGHYQKAFIAFNPFFRLKKVNDYSASKVAVIGGVEYFDADDWDIPSSVSFSYIKKNAEPVLWSEIHNATCPEIPFKKFALCVWISSCLGRREDVPRDLQERIESYCEAENIFLPEDDIMSSALEAKIGMFLQSVGLSDVDIYDEMGNKRTCNVKCFSSNFPSVMEGIEHPVGSCIHSKKLGLAMIWQFDGVEGVIGLSDRAAKVAFPEKYFEGFYADKETSVDWLNPKDFISDGSRSD